MVCGLDLHRAQITFDAMEVETGEAWRGRIWQPDRKRFRSWLRKDLAAKASGPVEMAVEGCTGWRYVVEEIAAAGFTPHLAEPADTQAARGRKRRAKTDRSDARLLRELLLSGDLPESWIPPEAVLEWRERVRLYKTLADHRTEWTQRIHAELYQHGVALPEGAIRSEQARAALTDPALAASPAARRRIQAGYAMIAATDAEAQPLRAELSRFGTRQPACRALVEAHFGIGELTAVAVWSELGDCRRFCRSMQVVRHAGIDVTVDASDRHRGVGTCLARGPRSCAGRCTRRPSAPPDPSAPTTRTTPGSKPPMVASWPPSRWPASWPGAATTPCAPSIPSWSTPFPRASRPASTVGIARQKHEGLAVASSCEVRARQHPCWTAF
jgi:transposase